MRMKHGSDRGPTTSAKPRLLAAFTAVAMMFATAVPSLLPRAAWAENNARPGICQSKNIELGDSTANPTEDSGIATWVGRDMYVGASKDDDTSYGQNGKTINQSYAVEAEGTTLVAGKLAINSVKKSWHDYGFRFGIVGFGAQYRPTSGDALVVANQNSNIKLTDRDNHDVSALGWGVNGRGWLGPEDGTSEPAYTAKIAGNTSSAMGLYGLKDWQPKLDATGYPGGYESVYSRPQNSNKVTWSEDHTRNLLENVNINGKTDNYSGRTAYFRELSAMLGSVTTTGTTSEPGNAPEATDYIREKYGSPDISNFADGTSKKTSIGVKMQFAEGTEKRIIFDGGYNSSDPDQTSSGNMVTFDLDPAYLNNGSSNGVVFDFQNIKPGASVVVNVKHAESDNQKTITFNNGWRFWWNGMEISNGYMTKWKGSTDQAPGNPVGVTKNAVYEAYGKASQSIIWNFQNTKKLTIRGGQVLGNNRATHWANAVWYKGPNAQGVVSKHLGVPEQNQPDPAAPEVRDDPAAAMLGSILVPNGSFEDHVTTNGRVWVGEDFSMYNPTQVWDFSKAKEIGEGWSSSIIDMDQERHNFPWSGSARTTCSTLSWTKANEKGELLGGTTWGVYGSKENAESEQNPIYIVKDNAGEWNPEDGKFRVDNLNPKNSYFIKEKSPADEYTLNKYIYEIYAENTGDTSNSEIIKAYDENGNEITDHDKWQLTTVGSGNSAVTAIVNKRSGTDLEWGKTRVGEQSGLAKSEWVLTKEGDPAEQWLIKDDVQSLEKIEILDTNGNLVEGTPQITLRSPATFKSRVFPLDTANQHVTWSVPEELKNIVTLIPSEDRTSVQIIVHGMPTDGQVTLTATGVDETTSASITIEVLQPQVSTLKIQSSNDLTVVVGHTLKLNATGKDSSGNPVQSISPQWTSSDTDRATVSSDGTVTGVTPGEVIITATVTTATGTVSDSVRIDVVADGTTILAEVPSGWDPYIWAWETGNESNNYTDGKWPGKQMKHVGGSTYSYFVPSTGAISVVISNNGKTKTGDIKNINGGTAKTWKVTGLTNDDNNNKGITTATPVSTRIGAPARRSANAKTEAGTSNVAAQTSWTPVDTTGMQEKQDENPAPGRFKVSGLAPGTYYLQENKAPDGYFVNPTKFTIVITEDGSVQWDTRSTTAVYVRWPNAKETPRILYWTGETAPDEAAAAKAPSMTAQACVEGSNGWYKYDVPIAGKAFNVKITAADETYKVGDKEVISIAGTKDAYTIDNDNDNKVTEGKPAKECPTATTTIYVQSTDPENANTPRILYWEGDQQPARGENNANGLWMSPEACAGNGMYKYDVPITGKSFNVQIKIDGQLLKLGDSEDSEVDVIAIDGTKSSSYTIANGKLSDKVPSNSCPAVQPSTMGDILWISDVPTEFSWDKVDAGYVEGVDGTVPKNPIEGSEWKLEKFQEPTTAGGNGSYATKIETIEDCQADDAKKCTSSDKDHRQGKFTLKGLEVGKYRLTETKAPAGYQKPDNVYYYFELSTKKPGDTTPVKWTKGTGEIDSTGAPDSATTTASDTNSERSVQNPEAPNYRLPGDVYWGKVSSETGSDGKHVYLGGSAWRVTYIPATGEGERVTVDITDCVSSGGSKTGTCDEAETGKPAWAFDSYPAAGRIGFRNLPWGTYELVETKAPDGYNVDSETVYTFTVDATHRENVRIYKKVTNGDPIQIPAPNNPEGAQLPDYPNQVISNTPGFELPSTGGEGNTLIMLFGVALTAISMLGCAIAMRKRI